MQGALDGDAVDEELVLHFGGVLFGVAAAVGFDGGGGDAALVAFALGGEFALVGKRALQDFVGVGQRGEGLRDAGARSA